MRKEEKKCALGVDFGGTSIKIGLVNVNGQVVQKSRIDTQDVASPDPWLDIVDQGLTDLTSAAGLSRSDLAGVGVGAPGYFDFERGYIYDLPNVPGWENLYFNRMAEERFGLPVYADNDANTMALGECTFGAGRLFRHTVFVTLGTGVGGALVLDHELYRGAHSLAGEIGHMSIDMNGVASPRGPGGIENYVGQRRLVERAIAGLKAGTASSLRDRTAADFEDLSVRIIAEEAAQGDALSCEVFDFAARCLATVFASITYLLQPQAFIVGGGVSRSGDVLFVPLRRYVEQRLNPTFSQRLEIQPAELGSDAGMIGAACLALTA